jgi:putative transposase
MPSIYKEKPTTRDRGPLGRSSSSQTWSPWSSRGYLPHYDMADVWQALTYRLADSMPKHVIESLESALSVFSEDDRTIERRKRIESWIDAGHGSCILRRDDIAGLILETWRRFAGKRYDLGPWVIIPNHVHVLIRVNPGFSLARVVGSWKSYTAKRIMQLTKQPAPIWWPDYWDRFIRDDTHWNGMRRYIENNPLAAGLVRDAAAWKWSSAFLALDR